MTPWDILIGAVKAPPPPRYAPASVEPKKPPKVNAATDVCKRCGAPLHWKLTTYCSVGCKYPTGDEDRVIALFREGNTRKSIREITGIGHERISQIIRNSGVAQEIYNDLSGKIVALKKAGKTFAEISAELGISQHLVYRRLRDERQQIQRVPSIRGTWMNYREQVLAEYIPGKTGNGGDVISRRLNIPLNAVRKIIREERARLGLPKGSKSWQK